MNRKMRAARNNKAAKLRRESIERKRSEPRCDHCGDLESEHTYVPIPAELTEAVQESGIACEIVPPKRHQH